MTGGCIDTVTVLTTAGRSHNKDYRCSAENVADRSLSAAWHASSTGKSPFRALTSSIQLPVFVRVSSLPPAINRSRKPKDGKPIAASHAASFRNRQRHTSIPPRYSRSLRPLENSVEESTRLSGVISME